MPTYCSLYVPDAKTHMAPLLPSKHSQARGGATVDPEMEASRLVRKEQRAREALRPRGYSVGAAKSRGSFTPVSLAPNTAPGSQLASGHVHDSQASDAREVLPGEVLSRLPGWALEERSVQAREEA